MTDAEYMAGFRWLLQWCYHQDLMVITWRDENSVGHALRWSAIDDSYVLICNDRHLGEEVRVPSKFVFVNCLDCFYEIMQV